MKSSNFRRYWYASALLLLVGSTAQATTLYVNCGGRSGGGAFTSIGAALKALQSSESHGSATINVSGACHENIVIQSLDRLTLNAVNGASVSDASGGKSSVILISDSRDVSINGFTINASSDGVSDVVGIGCGDWSSCRLMLNTIQGAASGTGFAVGQASQATVDGDTFQNNGQGMYVVSGSRVRPGGQGRPITVRNNSGNGLFVSRQSLAYVFANIDHNGGHGARARFDATLDLSGSSLSNNGGVGAYISEHSAVRISGMTVTGNAGPGVQVEDLSMVTFDSDTVTGNGGGTDVACNPQFPATRGTTDNIGGGKTNCVEPTP